MKMLSEWLFTALTKDFDSNPWSFVFRILAIGYVFGMALILFVEWLFR